VKHLPCGCCEPGGPGPPKPVRNPAGRDRLSWRIRRHPEFLAAMTAALSRSGQLTDLTTRDLDDPTIALLDAWAATLDVLTFYSERIANEAFLRTATERRSLAELAAMVGYELQPGAAAETLLAFTLETAAGAPEAVTVPAGTQVQSLPGPDEEPQLFETVADLEARAEWSAVPARPVDDAVEAAGLTHCVLAGRPAVHAGDVLLVALADATTSGSDADSGFVLVTVDATEPLGDREAVLVRWSPPLPTGFDGAELGPGTTAVAVYRPTTARPFGHNAPDWRTLPSHVQAAYGGVDPGGDWRRLTMDLIGRHSATAGGTATAHPDDQVHLDGDDHDVRAEELVVLADGVERRLYRAAAVAATSLNDFTLTRPVTRVTLSGSRDGFSIRGTIAYLAGRPLPLAAFTRHAPHTGTHVPLAHAVRPPEDGRRLVATGKRARLRVEQTVTLHADGGTEVSVVRGEYLVALAHPQPAGDPGELRWRVVDAAGRQGLVDAAPSALRWVAAADDGPEAAEVVTAAAPDDPGSTTSGVLSLRAPLAAPHDPATLRFNANVAPATHGETTTEVLGSGDASTPFQRVTLDKAPLTYLAGAQGATSTLTVRVNGPAWDEESTLYGLTADARAYTLRQVGDDAVVQFGDGRAGARPPTGQENLTATYRTGSGRAGNLRAGTLTQLRSRPLGVKAVTNPLAAEGGDDPESGERARRDAPLRVRTLDRVVSLTDYEDLAAAYPGVGGAAATWLWDGQRRVVHVTCTGPDGGSLPALTRGKVTEAIATASDRLTPFVVAGHERLEFVVAARLHVEGRRDPDETRAAAQEALTAAYAAPARQLARSVPASEVIATLHVVADVRGVDLLDFRLAGEPEDVAVALTAAPARLEGGTVHPAQLLALADAQVLAS
jgi:uncharacterized phage protein gp47/JayE